MKKILFSMLFASYLIADTITLTGTLRDFNQDHVDFEAHATWENGAYLPYGPFSGGKKDGLELGNVLEDLGMDGNPQVNPNSTNNFKPQKLEEWYRDVDGVNMSMPYSITLEQISEDLYRFSSSAFFPADGKLFGKEVYHHRTENRYQHNFHMTYKLHTRFTYKRGQKFNFTGDDDVWIFIDKKLAVDLGGIHTARSANVDLDTIGLVDGESYDFDFFWAERHSTGSNFTITTSIAFDKSEPFVCEEESFVSFNTVNGAGNGLSKFNTIALSDGTLTQEDSISGVNGVNSIGYNVKDNYIWGYNLGTYQVVRIGSDRKAKLYDISGLDRRFYVAADVDKNGILYLFSRENDSQKRHLARVDLNTMQALNEVEIDKAINTADMAFNPQDEKLYFVQNGTDTLYSIRFSEDGLHGYVSDGQDMAMDGRVDPIINFFDRDGNFYFNKDTVNMYKFNPATSTKAEPFSILAANLRNGDGARCANAKVTIQEPVITISDAEVIEGDSGVKNIVFTITSDKDIEYTEGLKLSYTLHEGSAKAGSDYNNLSGSFFMREKTYTLSLPIIKGDTIPESDEDFFIHLTASIQSQSVSFAKNRAKGLIIDNDKNILDAYDQTSSFTNPAIKTHIVNEPFQLKIVSVQPDNKPASSFSDITNTKMKIVTTASCTNDATSLNMGGFKPFSLTSSEQLSPTFKVTQAYKDARVQFYWEDAISGAKKASCSTDRFAVRPKKYVIVKPSSIKAGEDFHLIVKAVDADGKTVTNYIENQSSYILTIDETKASVGCPRGTYTKGKHDFYTGQSLVDLNYHDVGMLAFKVSEKHGSEFASIDSSDGSGDSRFISDGIDTITVDASQFAVNLSYTTLNSQSNYTYYSADPTTMGAKIKAMVMVKDALGNPLPNFTKDCYAKDVTVSFDPLQTGVGTVDLQNPDTTPATPLAGGRYSYIVSNTSFISNGQGSGELYLNFGRVTETPKLPLKMQLSNPSATIGTLVGSINPLDKTISFIYARAHGQDEQIGVGANFVATIDYEAYLPSSVNPADYGLTIQGKGKDDLRWSVLGSDTVFGYSFGTTPALKFSKASITASTPTTVSITSVNTPHTNIITYATKPYLSSSQETSGIKVKMLSPTNQWSGKGNTGQIFDDTASREIKRRMEW